MAIQVADGFSLQSQKPIDARLQFDTVANMKAYAENSLYNGCFAYVIANKTYYTFDSSNTVDSTTGKWREFSGGGSGATTLGNLTDVDVSTAQNGELLTYSSSEQKWKNNTGLADFYKTTDSVDTAIDNADYIPFYDFSTATKKRTLWSDFKSVLKTYFDTLYNKYTLPTATSSVLGGVKIGDNMLIEDGVINPSYLVVANKFNKADLYSTTEKVVGCWTDGRPIYQKTFVNCITLSSTDLIQNYSHGIANIKNVISCEGLTSTNDTLATNWCFPRLAKDATANILYWGEITASTTQIRVLRSAAQWTDATVTATIRYTKTTDAANSFKYADENDYSTSEKIIGTWIDGSNLYQKTVSCGSLPSNTTKTVAHGISNFKQLVNLEGIAVYPDTDKTCYPIPNTYALETNSDCCAYVDKTNINIITHLAVMSNYTTSYVTLRYTKTTG